MYTYCIYLASFDKKLILLKDIYVIILLTKETR